MDRRRALTALAMFGLALPTAAYAGTGVQRVVAASVVCGGQATLSVSQATRVQQVTGSNTLNVGMGGADLGVMWSDGIQVMHAFGDNFGTVKPDFGGPTGTDWKANALGFSSNRDLRNGIAFNGFYDLGTGDRQAFVPLFSDSEDGLVPTGGIHVNGNDYVSYMIFPKGHTDFTQTRANGIAMSSDGGNSWHRVGSAVWANNSDWSDNFQQHAFATSGDGEVYVYTTRSGRQGDVYLMRVAGARILDKGLYEYWTGSAWSFDQSQARPVAKGPAGEMSAMYDQQLCLWLMLYHDGAKGVTALRCATEPTGPWSDERTVLPDSQQTIYAPFMHPWTNGADLWFVGSDWSTYQVYLFHSDLKKG